MVKHIIIWTLKPETEPMRAKILADMKRELEALVGKVPGLISMNIVIEKLPSSTGDCMLDSTLTDAEALAGYAKHPDHVAAANTYVRPYTASRACIDYEI